MASPYESLREAACNQNSTIVFGNLSLFPELVHFHLQRWLKPIEDGDFESLVDGRPVLLYIEPEFGDRIPDDLYRCIVLTTHLDLEWKSRTTQVTFCHVPVMRQLDIGDKSISVDDPHMAYFIMLRFGLNLVDRALAKHLNKSSEIMKECGLKVPAHLLRDYYYVSTTKLPAQKL